MIVIRPIEVCPCCAQVDPWRKVSSRIFNGEKQMYVKCKRCGKRAKIVYRRATISPE